MTITAPEFPSPAPVCCALALAAVLLVLCGCGLEVYDNLAAINPDKIIPSTSYVTFSHNLSNAVDSFLGYDLYYRLFDSSEAGLIAPMKQTIEAMYISSIGQITGGYNFRKIVASAQDTSPFIDLSGTLKYESITMKLDFSYLTSPADPNDEPNITVTKDSDGSQVTKNLKRYIVPDLKTFRENGFLNNDYDIPTAIMGQNLVGKTVIVCMFVVAYGYDQTRSQSLTSQAVFLADRTLGNGWIFQIPFTQ